VWYWDGREWEVDADFRNLKDATARVRDLACARVVKVVLE
jgi:hypothetical protein